ncbi:hypothetical protein Tco_1379684, partial [Tanacetum coccineum]
FHDTSKSSNDNTNVVNAPREPCVVNQDPGVNSLQDPPQIDHNCCYQCGDSLDGIFCRQCICKSCGKGAHYGYNCPPKDPNISKPEPCNQTINEIPQTLPSLDPSCYSLPYVSKPNFVDNPPDFSYPPPQPPQDSVDHQGILQILNKMEENFEEIIRDGRKKIEDMSIEEMMHEQKLVEREIKEIINELDFNIWGSEVQKKEKAYEDEKYAAACCYMLSVTCDDEDDYIPLAITPDLPIEESENSLIIEDEPLSTIPATESDESELVESLIHRDTSIDHSSKIDPIFEEFADELAHIAPILPRIVEADFDPNDDTSSDDDDFEDIEYVSLEEVNDVNQEEKEFDLADILQI